MDNTINAELAKPSPEFTLPQDQIERVGNIALESYASSIEQLAQLGSFVSVVRGRIIRRTTEYIDPQRTQRWRPILRDLIKGVAEVAYKKGYRDGIAFKHEQQKESPLEDAAALDG